MPNSTISRFFRRGNAADPKITQPTERTSGASARRRSTDGSADGHGPATRAPTTQRPAATTADGRRSPPPRAALGQQPAAAEGLQYANFASHSRTDRILAISTSVDKILNGLQGQLDKQRYRELEKGTAVERATALVDHVMASNDAQLLKTFKAEITRSGLGYLLDRAPSPRNSPDSFIAVDRAMTPSAADAQAWLAANFESADRGAVHLAISTEVDNLRFKLMGHIDDNARLTLLDHEKPPKVRATALLEYAMTSSSPEFRNAFIAAIKNSRLAYLLRKP